MKIAIIIIISSVVVLLLATGFTNREDNSRDIIDNKTLDSSLDSNYASQSDNQARVTVDIQPKELGLDKDKNVFEVSLNTHSVEMDFDFSEIITLEDNVGNSYQALEWTGGRGGHHISGDIVFPAIDPEAETVEINILGVGGVDRVFKWDLL